MERRGWEQGTDEEEGVRVFFFFFFVMVMMTKPKVAVCVRGSQNVRNVAFPSSLFHVISLNHHHCSI